MRGLASRALRGSLRVRMSTANVFSTPAAPRDELRLVVRLEAAREGEALPRLAHSHPAERVQHRAHLPTPSAMTSVTFGSASMRTTKPPFGPSSTVARGVTRSPTS